MKLEVKATCVMPSKYPDAAALGGRCGHHVAGTSFREVKARMRLHYIEAHQAAQQCEQVPA